MPALPRLLVPLRARYRAQQRDACAYHDAAARQRRARNATGAARDMRARDAALPSCRRHRLLPRCQLLRHLFFDYFRHYFDADTLAAMPPPTFFADTLIIFRHAAPFHLIYACCRWPSLRR